MKDSSENLYKTAIEQLAFESGLPSLFFRRACTLFEEEKFDEALLEVKKGLKNYPGHPPAYYLLINIFLKLKKPNLAEITLNSAAKFFATGMLSNYYRELINETIHEVTNRNNDEERALSTFSIPEVEEEPELIIEPSMDEQNEDEQEKLLNDDVELIEQTEYDPYADPEVEDTIEGEYHNLGKNESDESLEKLEIENPVVPIQIPSNDNEIITAGMAIIYARQGNTIKAIEIFSKLIEKEPDKKESYEKIISLLKNKSQLV